MHVALADVDEGGLRQRTRRSARTARDSLLKRVDVSQAAQVEAFARPDADASSAACTWCATTPASRRSAPVWENSVADWQWILGVNLWGVIHGVRAFAPRLIAQDEGHIVNTASVAGLISPPGSGAYNVTKHAVVALSESLQHDLRERNSRVGVSVLCPAYVPTADRRIRAQPPRRVRGFRNRKETLAREAMLQESGELRESSPPTRWRRPWSRR